MNIRIVIGNAVAVLAIAGQARAWSLTERYTLTGAPDTTFGGTGYVISQTRDDDIGIVVPVANSKVLGGGSFTNPNNHSQMIVGRYAANGTPDTTFGYGGVTTIQIDPNGAPSKPRLERAASRRSELASSYRA